jgi:intracellular sulfur oxidation DsrE/DsrF family protein
MKKDEQFSEEQLNALIDNELDSEEKSRIYHETGQQPELDQRLCQQRKVKELVKLAYDDVPQPPRGETSSLGRRGWFSRALAAAVLLGIGLAAGFIGKTALEPGLEQVTVATEPDQYLIHVASGEPEDMAEALARAEYLLRSAGPDDIRQVEIVANERGVNLLRSDLTQFATEISTLQKNNVVFYACSKTIQRLEEKGEDVYLVPHTIANYTALDRVVTRMQEGWHYEKI